MITEFTMKILKRQIGRTFRQLTMFLVVGMVWAACAEFPDGSNELYRREPQESSMPEVIVWIEENLETPSPVGGGELQEIPELLKYEIPKYPELPRAAGFDGTIDVEIVVNEAGGVTAAEIVSGTAPPIMGESVLKAVRQFKYRPGMQYGKPAESRLLYRVHFEIVTSSRYFPGLRMQRNLTSA